MDIRESDRILEVCIGTGGNIPYFREQTKELVVGLDLSNSMLEICRHKVEENKWKNIELVLGCVEYIPFKENSFDKILIGGGISYFSDVKKALSEVARVAKPNSKIVVYEQVTPLDRLLSKNLLPLRHTPRSLKLLGYRHIFEGKFYIIEFSKREDAQRSSYSQTKPLAALQ